MAHCREPAVEEEEAKGEGRKEEEGERKKGDALIIEVNDKTTYAALLKQGEGGP